MPGIIGRVPTGLLGLLDMQSQGAAPRLLDDSVRATVEAFPFYASALRSTKAYSFTKVIGAGNENRFWPALDGASPVGPQLGRTWFVRNFTMVSAISGTSSRYTPAVIPQSYTDGQQWGQIVGSLANQTSGAMSFARDFWMLPGDHLGALLETVATYLLYCSVDYAEFPF